MAVGRGVGRLLLGGGGDFAVGWRGLVFGVWVGLWVYCLGGLVWSVVVDGGCGIVFGGLSGWVFGTVVSYSLGRLGGDGKVVLGLGDCGGRIRGWLGDLGLGGLVR